MSKKNQISYNCHACGFVCSKWSGRCPNCDEWGSLEELKNDKVLEVIDQKKLVNFEKFDFTEKNIENLKNQQSQRISTCIRELDCVLGGGFVRGSVVLIGGEPGIGKSTLLLQIAQVISAKNLQSFYVSGEESSMQVRLRAARLREIANANLNLLSSTSLEEIVSSISNICLGKSLDKNKVDLLIIDSIQTISSEKISSSTGSIAQVKLCTNELVELAKSQNIITIIVGHITKDGAIAGPKFLEHMVDAVLYFEGEQNYRILRSVKNRYGASGEIAIFEMNDNGLQEITNPSMFFLNSYNRNISGSVVFAGIEGSRPVMVEIQALIAHSYTPMPRRAAVGLDLNRVSIILAVLSSRCKIITSDKEVYLNVVGGLKLNDPSADLAVAASLLSMFYNKAISEKTIIFGEIGLAGEVRRVQNVAKRIKEAIKLGFRKVIMPDQEISEEIKDIKLINLVKIKYLTQLNKVLENNIVEN